ncbi:MAG: MmpS family protein [Mycobacterium sp.]
MFGVLRRGWLPLMIVAVIAVGGFTVHRVHGYFGGDDNVGASSAFQDTEPFHPKVVVYDIFSPAGATDPIVDINYLDLDAEPQRLDGASLPWSLTLETTNPAVSPNIVAQGTGDSIGCRITIDGVVKDERVSDGASAYTFCLVKSA